VTAAGMLSGPNAWELGSSNAAVFVRLMSSVLQPYVALVFLLLQCYPVQLALLMLTLILQPTSVLPAWCTSSLLSCSCCRPGPRAVHPCW
jgi:hypothetical protein